MTSAKNSTIPTSSVLQSAYDYVARGWHVIQLHSVGPDGTCHCDKGMNCGSAGKHPVIKKWHDGEAPDADQVAEMWAKRPKANIGIATGSKSGFFVLDIDPDSGGRQSAERILSEVGTLPPTRVVKTGSNGFHYYFQMPDFEVGNSNKWFTSRGYVGIDIRGTGGQVVAPPSRSGKGPYVLLDSSAEIAQAPAWLLEAVRAPEPVVAPLPAAAAEPVARTYRHEAYERRIVAEELKRLTDLARYGWDRPWDQTTYDVCCNLIELANADWSALTLPEARDQILQMTPRDPGFTDETVHAKWNSALAKVGDKAKPAPADRRSDDDLLGAAGNPDVRVDPTSGGGPAPEQPVADFPRRELNDVGNAQRLVDRHGHRLRFARDSEAWLTYDGGVWSDTVSSTVLKALAIHTIAAAKSDEADQHSDDPAGFKKNGDPLPSPREEFHKWMGASLMSPRLSAMLTWAEPDRRVASVMRDFDRDPMLLNAKNCVVDLTTGQTQPHAPELMMKHQTRIEYDPDAKAPKWEAFLERVQPDPEIRDYLQRVIGYSATADMREQSFWIHIGPGATGKTTFLEVIQEVMGDYGQVVSRETLMAANTATDGNAPNSDIAAMEGARFLATSETAAGKKLAEQKIKQLVGGDTYKVRHLYGKPYMMNPTGKIHMATNHLPGLTSGGDGLGRRIKIVGWDVKIPKGQQDKGLKDKILREEAAGVLAWLVRGAMLWFAEGGLTTPADVDARSEDHMRNADPLFDFIDERLALEEGASVDKQEVVKAYKDWCFQNNHPVMTGGNMAEALDERGFKRGRDTVTRRVVLMNARLLPQVVHMQPVEGFFARA